MVSVFASSFTAGSLPVASVRALHFVLIPLLLAGCGPTSVCSQTDLEAPADLADNRDRSPRPDTLYISAGDVFEMGDLSVEARQHEPCEDGAPLRFWSFVPQQPGTYGVLVFQHSVGAGPFAYIRLLSHVASHGFVVIAPFLEPSSDSLIVNPPAEVDADAVLDLIDWLPSHLRHAPEVRLERSSLGLIGHSRGGKLAWIVGNAIPERVRGIVTYDPVDSTVFPLGNGSSAVLESPRFDAPTVMIGAGIEGICFFGHFELYFEASPSPAWQVVIPDSGHLDIIDTPGGVPNLLCGHSEQPEDVKRLVAGMMVALFRGTMQGDAEAMRYLNDTSITPVEVELSIR